MEEITDIPIPTKKVYKDRAIWTGTFLGGPLVAGYMMAKNFKVFGDKRKYIKTWIFSIIATVIIFGGVFLIPDNVNIPNQIIPLFYTGIAYLLVYRFQKQKINAHISAGGKFYNWWRVIAVGFIGLAITIIPVFAFFFIYDAIPNNETSKTYGILKHEIVFDKDNITESEVDKLADGLIQINFFDQEETKYVYAKKVENNYELSISCNETVKNNFIARGWFVGLRSDMQKLFPSNKIIFLIVVDDLDNIIYRLE
jgi:hypothetical protein